jgi:hypothetical protein
MKNADTTKKMPPKHDWNLFDSMSEKQRHAAALNDPDAQPVRVPVMGGIVFWGLEKLFNIVAVKNYKKIQV